MQANTLRIGTRLGLAFGIVLMLTALVAIIGIWRLGTLKTTVHELATVELERNDLSQKWTSGINLNWVRTSAALQSESQEYISAMQKEMDVTSKSIGEIQKRIEPLIVDETGKNLVDEIAKMRELYRTPRATLMKKKIAGEDVTAQVKTTLQPLAENYLNALVKLEQHMNEQLTKKLLETDNIAVFGQSLLAFGALASVLLGVFFAYMVSKSVTRPIGEAVSAARSIMNGDLSIDIQHEGTDEAAQMLEALLAMRNNLSKIVGDVRENAQGGFHLEF